MAIVYMMIVSDVNTNILTAHTKSLKIVSFLFNQTGKSYKTDFRSKNPKKQEMWYLTFCV
jgi:hypothetical protein